MHPLEPDHRLAASARLDTGDAQWRRAADKARRVLQERSVLPLGGGIPLAVDFALVCATHSQLRAASDTGATPLKPKPVPAPKFNHGPQNLEHQMRLLVQQALQTTGGNVSQAARTLGISRQTFYKKMKSP
jgi:transcriptional regulator of acetoin/glycerol metabolism